MLVVFIPEVSLPSAGNCGEAMVLKVQGRGNEEDEKTWRGKLYMQIEDMLTEVYGGEVEGGDFMDGRGPMDE